MCFLSDLRLEPRSDTIIGSNAALLIGKQRENKQNHRGWRFRALLGKCKVKARRQHGLWGSDSVLWSGTKDNQVYGQDWEVMGSWATGSQGQKTRGFTRNQTKIEHRTTARKSVLESSAGYRGQSGTEPELGHAYCRS